MNRKSIIAIVLLVLAVLLIILCPTVELMLWFSIIGIIFGIIALVLNHIVKSEKCEKKSITTLCNIFGVLIILFCFAELVGTVLMSNPDLNEPICKRTDMVGECVDQGDGVSNCKYMKQIDIPCNTDVLEESQIK